VLAPGSADGRWNVFVYDRILGTMEWISRDANGGPATGDSEQPKISADGRFVVFESAARDLVGDDATGWQDVFIHDRTTGETSLVSVDSAGDQADARSGSAGVSSNGQHIVFSTLASSLYLEDDNNEPDVYLRDRAAIGCEADTNGDRRIDFEDLNIVLFAFNSVEGEEFYLPSADLDDDNAVGFADLNLVIGGFGTVCW
jgi:Tol biopolymer transport system component